MNNETTIYEQLAQYLNLKHPGLIYHFDLSGVYNPSHKTRNLYGRLNRRAWPDLFIVDPYEACKGQGLFIEIKKENTRLKKKNGEWATEHIAEQAKMLEELEAHGYHAEFGIGYDSTIQIIERYLA